MTITTRTGMRRRAAELLRKGETPEVVRNVLKSMGTKDKDIPRLVYEEMQKLRIEEPEETAYEPPYVDTTGLVEIAAGHWADPRSAELIRSARA
jgi:heterodisulfide reductase subunit B